MGGPAIIGNKSYDELDNFFICSIIVAGYEFFSSEQYFQCLKFVDIFDPLHKDSPCYSHFLKILNNRDPLAAWQLGNSRKFPIRESWDSLRYKVMKEGVKFKLTQNPKILGKLLSSSGPIDVPYSDEYWRPANAQILTELRRELAVSTS